MGKQIVYCCGCGCSLYEDQFASGKATTVDHRPYCGKCAPPGVRSLPTTTPPPMSVPAALPRKTSTAHIRVVPQTTRRGRATVPAASRTPLLVGAGLAVVGLVILIVVASTGGGRREVPPPGSEAASKPPPSLPPKPAPPAGPDRSAVVQALESFAATSLDPDAVLQRSEEALAAVRGTPHEARVRAVQDAALRKKKDLEQARKLAASIDDVQRIRASDTSFRRRPEVESMLQSALELAGPQQGVVRKMLEDYQREAAAFAASAAARPPEPEPLPLPAGAGPFELDPKGGIENWLVLGPFGNRADPLGMYDHDLLRKEATHVPAAGLTLKTREDRQVSWTPAAAPAGKLLFRTAEPFSALPKDAAAIAFAACWITVEKDLEIKYRISADRGFRLWVAHALVGHSPGEYGLDKEEQVYRAKLSAGTHVVLVKVGTHDGPLGMRLRITVTHDWVRAPGVRVYTAPPPR